MKIGDPYLLQIHITSKCPLKCSYCYLEKDPPVDLSFDKIKRFLEKFNKYYNESGLKVRINLTGGDIFLYPDLEKLLKYIQGQDFIEAIYLMINSFYRKKKNKKIITKFRKKIMGVQINTDIATKDDVIFLKKEKIPAAAKIMLSKNSDFHKQLKKIIELREPNDHLAVSIDRLSPQTKDQIKFLLPAKEQAKQIKILLSIFQDKFITEDPLVRKLKTQFLNKGKLIHNGKESIDGCIIPNGGLAVFPDGQIKLCARISNFNTNFTIKNFDLIKYVNKFNKYSSANNQQCKNCAVKNKCPKGCLSTYIMYNDRNRNDSLCPLKMAEQEPSIQSPELEVETDLERSQYLDHLKELPVRHNLSADDLDTLSLFFTAGVQANPSLTEQIALSAKRFVESSNWLEVWQEVEQQRQKRNDYYSINTLHYRQREPIGCSVSCYLMAQSALVKDRAPSRAAETEMVRELSENGQLIDLSTLMTKAVNDGFKVGVFSERDYTKEEYEETWEQRRRRYVGTLENLESSTDFSNTSNIEFDDSFFLEHLRAGKPVLVNGVTESGIPHMQLVSGYRKHKDQWQFLVSDPLDSRKQWQTLSDLEESITPPFGKWVMVLSKKHDNRKLDSDLAGQIYAQISYFSPGEFGENSQELLNDTNVPYTYLSPEIRAHIPAIVRDVIVPRIQDALRQGKTADVFKEEIAKQQEIYDPKKMTPEEYLGEIQAIYLEKINLQKTIAQLLLSLAQGRAEDQDKAQKRLSELAKRSFELEPKFFGATARVKDFIAYWDENTLQPRAVSEQERNLFLTPSIQAFPLWLQEIPEQEEQAIGLFFNLDPHYYSEWERQFGLKKPVDTSKPRPSFERPNTKKLYLLLERPMPSSRVIDQLLVLDNTVEKFYEFRYNFLHDLFARIYLVRREQGKTSFPDNKEELEKDIEKALENL